MLLVNKKRQLVVVPVREINDSDRNLHGELGTGKTTFVKGLAQGLDVKSPQASVNSPTFVLMNIYDGKWPIYHFDLYRIEGAETSRLGYEEFLYGQGIAVIEWAERLGRAMPAEFFSINLAHAGKDERTLDFKAQGKDYRRRLKEFRM